jgi:hypothetical protein
MRMREKMQQGFIELHRILQECEVANIWQNQFACVGNEPRHTIRVIALDEFIAVAVYDPSRNLDVVDAYMLYGRIVRNRRPKELPNFAAR